MSASYEKVIFYRDAGAPLPDLETRTLSWRSAAADPRGFQKILREVVTGSLDRHDAWVNATFGSGAAARAYLEPDPAHFVSDRIVWEAAWDGATPIGIIQPLTYAGDKRDARPRGTIGYIGVVPPQRGRGFVLELLVRGTLALHRQNVWQIFCDTDTLNFPMIAAFERCGYTRGGVRAFPVAGWHKPNG